MPCRILAPEAEIFSGKLIFFQGRKVRFSVVACAFCCQPPDKIQGELFVTGVGNIYAGFIFLTWQKHTLP